MLTGNGIVIVACATSDYCACVIGSVFYLREVTWVEGGLEGRMGEKRDIGHFWDCEGSSLYCEHVNIGLLLLSSLGFQ